MARLTLTATQAPGTGSSAPLDLTALLTAGSLGSNTGVSFPWNPTYKLFVLTVTGATTIIVNIGTTIEGQAVASITLNATTAAHVYEVGPFPLDEEQQGAVMWVDFGTAANVSGVALIAG
jgi:hypothetical protein